MKNRLFAALVLTALLAVPVFAQQTGSTTPDQSAQPAASQPAQTSQPAAMPDQSAQPAASQPAQTSQPAAADQNAPAESATGKPLQPPPHEGFWGHLNPFARKKYVQRQTEPIRDRVNELDELTSTNTKQIKDVDSRAQSGIKLASDKANEADQHAIDAGNKATAAQQSAQQVTTRVQNVETVVSNIDQYKASNQTEIRFRPGQTVLSKNAKDALDQMATSVKGQRGYIIEVQGFSSGKGQTAITNSQKMAE